MTDGKTEERHALFQQKTWKYYTVRSVLLVLLFSIKNAHKRPIFQWESELILLKSQLGTLTHRQFWLVSKQGITNILTRVYTLMYIRSSTVAYFIQMRTAYRLCGLVVRVPGYRLRGPGSIPGATSFSETLWVWNGAHPASWAQLRRLLERKSSGSGLETSAHQKVAEVTESRSHLAEELQI
jgi:hypothetical protein